MSFGKGSSTTTQTTGPDPQAMQAYQGLLGRAQSVASTPWQPYGGDLVAGFTPDQSQAFQQTRDLQGAANPYINTAAGLAQTGAGAITPDMIARYTNPYQQQVVDATRANLQENNEQQRQQMIGNQIARGSLGGDRAAVGEAELRRQQNLSDNSTIAGLYSQGYGQALGAAQNEAARAGQGAYTFGNLGQEALTTGLSQNQALLGTGGLQQQLSQAQLNVPYEQWKMAQAFPYQQTQWLAGIETGVGSQMGGTSQTTAPPPNPWGQVAGLGVTAAGAFLSDRRVKENVEEIGRLNDGQKIYRFNYTGDPRTQIGLMAQDVERSHPDAVHDMNGIKAVDYDAATSDAVDRWSGGRVAGFALGGAPFGDVQGFVPTNNITYGKGPPVPPKDLSGTGSDPSKMMQQAMGLAKDIRSNMGTGQPTDIGSPEAGFAPSQIGDVWGAGMSPGVSGLGPIYRRGGFVPVPIEAFGGRVMPDPNGIYMPRGYADGGMPTDFDDRFSPVDTAARSPGFADYSMPVTGGLGSMINWDAPRTRSVGTIPLAGRSETDRVSPEDRAAVEEQPADDADVPKKVRTETIKPPVQVDTSSASSADALGLGVPYRGGNPDVVPKLAAGDDGPDQTRAAPDRTAGFAPQRLDSTDATGLNPLGGVDTMKAPDEKKSGFGLGYLTPSQQMGLMHLGASMMASRRPDFLGQLGEGAQAGLAGYTGQQKAEREEEKSKAEVEYKKGHLGVQEKHVANEAQRLTQSALKAQQDIDRHFEVAKETARHHQALEDRANFRQTGKETPDGHPIVFDIRRPGVAIDSITGKPIEGDAKIVQSPGRGSTAAQGGVWKVKRDAYLSVHPGDEQGALDYAGGKRQMSEPDIMKSALTLAERSVKDDVALMGKPAAVRKAAIDQLTREYAATIRGGGTTAPTTGPAQTTTTPQAGAWPTTGTPTGAQIHQRATTLGLPQGSLYNPARKMWKTPDGRMFDEAGKPVQ